LFWSEDRIVSHHALMRAPARVIGPPNWLIAVVVGIAAVSVVGRDLALVTLSLFTSLSGIAVAAIGVFWIAAGLMALIDPKHAARNAAIIAIVIVVSLVAFIAVASFQPSPPGTSRGGPNVLPPPGSQVAPN
jgi:hypothetical protein